jgi:hypothetical protein
LRLLESTQLTLHEALSNQQQFEPEPSRARTADLAEDQAWSAFHDWLVGWTKLRGTEAALARNLYTVLFPTRLKFTRLAYKLEWAEADARLARIQKDGFDKPIEQLGGSAFLAQLKEAHLAYGDALGITAEGQEASANGLREPLNQLLAKLRSYVLSVAAYADETDEASVALTESLLAPLQQWKSRPTESTTTDDETPVVTAPVTSKPVASTPVASQVTPSTGTVTKAAG